MARPLALRRALPASLRSRLLLLVGTAYLPAVALTVIAIRRDRAETLAQAEHQLQRAVSAAAGENDALVRQARRIIGTWAQVPAVRDGGSAACEAQFDRLLPFAQDVSTPTRIGVDGRIDCGGRDASVHGRYVGDNPIFRAVLQADTAILGPYLPADERRGALLPINLALRNDRRGVTGVLSFGMRLEWLERLSSSELVPAGTIVAVVDSSDRVIARVPAPLRGERAVALGSLLRAAIASSATTAGMVTITLPRQPAQLVSFRRLASAPGTQVSLLVSMDRRMVFAAAERRAWLRILAVSITALLALGIVWVGAGALVVRDVESLIATTDRIGRGELDTRTAVNLRSREIRRLADAIDRMAQQLALRDERIRHAERMESLGQLAGGVAHDFNNLLAAITVSADLALESLDDNHSARVDLVAIRDLAGHSGSLTRQLLDFARRGPLTATPQSLGAALASVATLLGRTLPARISLDVHIDSDQVVRVDAARLSQAVINLASNARDAMPDGGRLTIVVDDVNQSRDVAAATQPPPGRWVRIRVSDTGSGMTADVQRRIFDPFFTTKSAGAGTGLGLAMVQATVEQHDGLITVESTVGMGSTFTIWLPACDEGAAGDAEEILARPVTGTTRHVLVVEDQPALRQLLERVLRSAGFTVVSASSGSEALALANVAPRIDVVVTDYDLPGLRGDHLALALRQRFPQLPLVLISGFAVDGWPAELFDTGRTTTLEKPFTREAIVESVTRLAADRGDSAAATRPAPTSRA